jgi:hypothetical protein
MTIEIKNPISKSDENKDGFVQFGNFKADVFVHVCINVGKAVFFVWIKAAIAIASPAVSSGATAAKDMEGRQAYLLPKV